MFDALDVPNSSGRSTPLSYAASMYGEGICKLLLDLGASVDLADSSGRTPLSYAVLGTLDREGICKLLLDRGATVDIPDSFGHTPLPYAVGTLDGEAVCKLLLDRGATVDIAGSIGHTPLSYAVGTLDGEAVIRLAARPCLTLFVHSVMKAFANYC